MRMRAFGVAALVALITAMSIPGRAAPITCGGTAPQVSECSVEGVTVTADNPSLRVYVGSLFLGVVQAALTSDTGVSTITCVYQLKPPATVIAASCTPQKNGIIYKDQTVTLTASATGKPGQLPAIGSWTVESYAG